MTILRLAALMGLAVSLIGCASGPKEARNPDTGQVDQQALVAAACERQTFDIYFGSEEVSLNAAAMPVVDDVVLRANECGVQKLRIEGYADAVGPADVNRVISEQRAEQVATALREAGLSTGRLEIVPFGEQFAKTDTGLNTPLARRVVVTILE